MSTRVICHTSMKTRLKSCPMLMGTMTKGAVVRKSRKRTQSRAGKEGVSVLRVKVDRVKEEALNKHLHLGGTVF